MWGRPAVRACSFCGGDEAVVAKLIAGPRVHICDRCVELCNKILAGEPAESFARKNQTDEALLLALRSADAAIGAMGDLLQEQVDELRRRGISWQRIGEALGVSRQAVWERFSSRE